MTDRDILRTHSLRRYDDLIWKEHLRSAGGWMLGICALAFAVWLLVMASGCGGGPQAQARPPVAAPPVVSPPPAPPPSNPPPAPPPPVILPAHYALTLLQPVAGGTSAQAEAIAEDGTVVGWSVVDDLGEATEWKDGRAIDLGPGFALAINGSGQAVGYVTDANGLPQAWAWPGGSIGTLDGYDSSEALGIDEDGTVVGVAFNMAAGGQAAFRRTQTGGMAVIPGMQTALAIRHSHVAGIGDDFNARVDDTALPAEGAATGISDAGACGYTFGSATEGFSWQDGRLVLLGTNGTAMSLASGINAGGIVVGQQGASQAAGSVRLARRGLSAKAMAIVARDVFVGGTRAMAWTEQDGMVDLNGRMDGAGGEWGLVFATGISDSGIVVGAAVSGVTMQTVGFVLEARP